MINRKKFIYINLMMLVILLISINVLAEDVEVDFVDENLEALIREELGQETGGISKGDLLEITVLETRGRDIKSLEEIKHLANLEELFLVGNREEIDITPVSNLTNLQILRIKLIKLTDLSLLLADANFDNLEKLNLISNEISDISSLADADFDNLEWLHLRGNEISDI